MHHQVDSWLLMWYGPDGVMAYQCNGGRGEAVGILRAFLDKVRGLHFSSPTSGFALQFHGFRGQHGTLLRRATVIQAVPYSFL